MLIRRNIADGARAFFTTLCPAGTGIETLVTVEGQSWTIKDSFETAKNEFGLDHNESRSWHGWHRHVSLVMLAFAMMATIRTHANRLAFSTRPGLPTQARQALSLDAPGNPSGRHALGTTTHLPSLRAWL